MDTVKIGIIGTGWIAEKMAITLEGMEGVEAYAVASRQLQTACDFADRWGFTRAYGSYEEMLDDEEWFYHKLHLNGVKYLSFKSAGIDHLNFKLLKKYNLMVFLSIDVRPI